MSKFEEFAIAEKALSAEETKLLKGGVEEEGGGSCGYTYTNSTGGTVTFCATNRAFAKSTAEANGGWWCCDSCSTTSYCGS